MPEIRKWINYLGTVSKESSTKDRDKDKELSYSQRLPPELLDDIFTALDDEDAVERVRNLRHLSLVCRAWRQTGQSLLFQHIEPQSYHSLRLLYKVVKSDLRLASHVRAIIPPPLSGFTLPRSIGWRTRFSYLRSYLSYRDYLRMIGLFHSLSTYCPNVKSISIPWCSYRGELGVGDYRLTNFDICHLQELVLTPCIFHGYLPHDQCSTEPIHLPRLITLTVRDINLSGVPLLAKMSIPSLERLVLDGVYGIITNFEQIVVELKHLNALQVTRGHFYENEDIAATPHWPWIVDPVFSTISVPTLQELCVDALPISGSTAQLQRFEGLRRLELRAYEASTFFELKSKLHHLTHLSICYRSSSMSVFKLISALAAFVAQKQLNAPNLIKITIKWRCLKFFDALMLTKVLLFCLSERCQLYGITTDIEINAVVTIRELTVPVSYAKTSLDGRSWIAHKYSLPHLLDRGPVLLQLYR